MELEREERRKEMIQRKEARKHEKLRNIAEGNPGDIDFIGMVSEWQKKQQMDYKKEQHKQEDPNMNSGNICITVRKRPVSDKEQQKLIHYLVSCFPPKIWIHSAKFKVDGILPNTLRTTAFILGKLASKLVSPTFESIANFTLMRPT